MYLIEFHRISFFKKFCFIIIFVQIIYEIEICFPFFFMACSSEMEPVWFRSDLSEEIIKNDGILNETHNIVTDIVTGKLEITVLVENLCGILTHKDPDIRVKGVQMFTKLLKELPKAYLSEMQVKFISKFYVDRLKDNHRVIPHVLEGYLAIIVMDHYSPQNCAEFFSTLLREVSCQSQIRQDRYKIYTIMETLLTSHLQYVKKLGPDFVYAIISAMDGERDPRNLLYLFSFLPKLMSNISLGHLVEEMFSVISCYFPIDFHASPDDPAAVTRQELADALAPCLCTVPEFSEQCLVLLTDKLDSSLRLAKIDSLKLLALSCNTFPAISYRPFLKVLWSSIRKEITHKTDDELKIIAHEALSALIKKLSTLVDTELTFENYVKNILLTMQTAMAESSTVIQFTQATRVILTTANASKESCLLIAKSMVPATIAYYNFKTSPKLQVSSLGFLGDMYDIVKHWGVEDKLETLHEIPQLCLTAVSEHDKEYQIAGFKLLMRTIYLLQPDLVFPFVEILVHNIQFGQDGDLLTVCVETVHAIARIHPEMTMDLVVRGKCDLNNLTKDQSLLQKRLILLCNLASIDNFTKVILEQMLKIIILTNKEDAQKVMEALNISLSNSSFYTEQKVIEMESDHGLIDSVLAWLITETSKGTSISALAHGYSLVTTTFRSLPDKKQKLILEKHTQNILETCYKRDVYFLILECLYNSVRQNIFNNNFIEIVLLSLKLCLESEEELIRNKACILVAHFLNKADYGENFDSLYEAIKNMLSCCNTNDENLCSKLLLLYGWLTKSLIVRGSDLFSFWLNKIIIAISNSELCNQGADCIQLIMIDLPDSLNTKCHCRVNFLYKQRFFHSFRSLTENVKSSNSKIKEALHLSWAYILEKVSKNVLLNDADRIATLAVDSLDYDSKHLLTVMIEVLSHLVLSKHKAVADSLQTILPRLMKLSKYMKSMDVRIKSLQCLYDIANSYPTIILLPYRQDILLNILPALDDNKRMVRASAVRARTRWFLVGSPGEEKPL